MSLFVYKYKYKEFFTFLRSYKFYLIPGKGNESTTLSEIPDIYTIEIGEPIKVATEPINVCQKCFHEMEKMWVVCPWCGQRLRFNLK